LHTSTPELQILVVYQYLSFYPSLDHPMNHIVFSLPYYFTPQFINYKAYRAFLIIYSKQVTTTIIAYEYRVFNDNQQTTKGHLADYSCSLHLPTANSLVRATTSTRNTMTPRRGSDMLLARISPPYNPLSP